MDVFNAAEGSGNAFVPARLHVLRNVSILIVPALPNTRTMTIILNLSMFSGFASITIKSFIQKLLYNNAGTLIFFCGEMPANILQAKGAVGRASRP